MAYRSKAARRAGVPVGVVIVVLAVGVMFGAAFTAILVSPRAPARPVVSTAPAAGGVAVIPPEEPAGAKKTFTAQVVAVRGDGFVVALPDMPRKGKAVPTVAVRVTADATFAAHVPKTPQEIDQTPGAPAPDAAKGFPPPPARDENDLYKNMPLALSDLMADDVVRIETTDVVGAKEIVASSVTLIFRPSAPAAADDASAAGALPPPSGIEAVPVKTKR